MIARLFRQEGMLWSAAFLATLLIPWALMGNRAIADSLCVAIGVLFLLRSAITKNWAWLKAPYIKVALLAWAWMVLAVSPFALEKVASFGIALAWIRFVVMFAALRQWVLVRREAVQILAVGIAVMLCLVIVDTFWQYVTGVSFTGHPRWSTGRLTGPLDSVKVGVYIAKLSLPALGICFFLAMDRAKKLAIAACTALLMACIATILLSGERTAFFSIMLGIATVITLVVATERSWRMPCLVFFAALLAGSIALLYTQTWLQERAVWLSQNLGDFGESSYGQLFQAGLILGREHWLTGIGFKNFHDICMPLMQTHGISYCDLHPHNPYIEWFTDAGAAGVLLFVALIAGWAVEAFRRFNKESGVSRLLPAFALGTLVLQFFPLMATQSFFSNWPAILLWYSLALVFSGFNLLKKP